MTFLSRRCTCCGNGCGRRSRRSARSPRFCRAEGFGSLTRSLLVLPGDGRKGVQGGTRKPGRSGALAGGFPGSPCVLIFVFDLGLDLTSGGGVESLFPDLDLSLFEGLRSGTFETERSHLPAQVDLLF
jgi:hypothetical protein